ncbi:MAG TPA: D-alanyl-D-alanine carboxypeptidase/D-alanyl-D-alanine-endopeptidase [Bryobacteraceae bacterium]|nr:D-alanyl-D-alanine carboxypeptidase/D-alanyl-D-alanine-endopeptidase [Bryobacteraceae bacterium]
MRWGATAVSLLCAASLGAASLDQQITELIDTTPAARGAFLGIDIVDLSSGQTLYSRNADKLFVPASNAKLFTIALALSRLGPDHRFETRVLASAQPGSDGVIRGGLRLIGGGDPNLSGRGIPYSAGAATVDPLTAIEGLADQIVQHGVHRVEGGIIGDDTWYVWEPYPAGWAVDDAQYDYGAPVSALSINDNALTLTIRPGARVGDPAALSLSPALEYYEIDNRVRTVAGGGEPQIASEREPGGRQVRLWGTLPLRAAAESLSLAIDDPAEYAARALRQALGERGVSVDGGVSARHRPAGQAWTAPAGVELAWQGSAPLLEDLRITAKVSQNLHAELALRAVARKRDVNGSREAGLDEMKTFLTEIGIDPNSHEFHDGSGLARLDLVSPAAMLQLLRAMYTSPLRDDWMNLLPVGGQDGTLKARFADVPALGRIRAKTGTLTHVSALSGYAQRKDGGWVAFSILVNNHNARAGDVRALIDRICTFIMEG